EYLRDERYVSSMKSPQIKSIMKSDEYTSGDKTSVSSGRKNTLIKELEKDPAKRNTKTIRTIIKKKLSPEEVAGLKSDEVEYTDTTGAKVKTSILFHPDVIKQYDVKIIKRVAEEMDAEDSEEFREVLEKSKALTSASVQKWLDKEESHEFL